MTFPEHLEEARAWAATWSGKLAIVAASLAGILAADPSVAIVATDLLPSGPIRIVAIIALVSVTYILPLKATKKDAAGGEG